MTDRRACPRHPDVPLKFNGGLLWCPKCKANVPDAVEVRSDDMSEPEQRGSRIRFLPDAALSEDTEFLFIDGRPFVNAHKHEEVVNRHVAEIERLREREVAADRMLRAAYADAHPEDVPADVLLWLNATAAGKRA